ncbi:hypothetical protein FHY30_003354 [Xanthomonas arboricola]|nr:hypothetical protein [Xanthomonas campestris]
MNTPSRVRCSLLARRTRAPGITLISALTSPYFRPALGP